MASTHESIWAGRGKQTMDAIYTAVAKDYNVAELAPFQRTTIGNAFMGWLQSDPRLVERYMGQDPRLTEEFLTEYRSGFIDPVRRGTQAGDASTAAGNRHLPGAPRGGGAGAGATVAGAGAGGGQPLTPDQVHDKAWDAFSAARRAAAGG